MDILEITGRAIVSVLVLFFLTKFMGKKQISQLNFFDYVVGISVGSIAAQMAFDRDLPFHYPIIAMAVYALCSVLISIGTLHSVKLRRFLVGAPIVIIDRGKILEKNLKAAKLDINDILVQMRIDGFYNIADIYYAIMEPNGKISFLPKVAVKPASREDLKIVAHQEGLTANVIMDGNVMKENLKAIDHDESWLWERLKEQGWDNTDEIFLAVCDSRDQLSVFPRIADEKKTNIFQ